MTHNSCGSSLLIPVHVDSTNKLKLQFTIRAMGLGLASDPTNQDLSSRRLTKAKSFERFRIQ